MEPVTLIIITPEGEAARAGCDSVSFFTRDNSRGENGGSMGVRRGHMPAIAALEPGSKVKASSKGAPVLTAIVDGGFASVRNDVVTVVTGRAEII